jgi:hypothetical protein
MSQTSSTWTPAQGNHLSEPFHVAQSARMRTWTALTSLVARVGQERILRRIFQLLSWALARSPGPRWRAWAALTSFWFRASRR